MPRYQYVFHGAVIESDVKFSFHVRMEGNPIIGFRDGSKCYLATRTIERPKGSVGIIRFVDPKPAPAP